MSTELIGFLSVGFAAVAVGVSLAVFIWRISVHAEKRSDDAHEKIGENISEVKIDLREVKKNLGEVKVRLAENSTHLEWIKSRFQKSE